MDADLIGAAHGISGTTLARPQLALLRDKAAAGEIEHLLLLTPKRRARTDTPQGVLVAEVQKLGGAIPFVHRQSAPSPEAQRLLPRQGGLAAYAREKLLER